MNPCMESRLTLIALGLEHLHDARPLLLGIRVHSDSHRCHPYIRPMVSDATIEEAAAIEERDRAAGGPPWEVADHPDHNLPGGWHRGQIRPMSKPGPY